MIDVVVGVIRDAEGRILLTQRQQHQDFAQCWEFPGGKIEPGETAEQALRRELREEVSIEATCYTPLIEVPWHYAHKSVCLRVYLVSGWQGVPAAAEGQQMRWVPMVNLAQMDFPAANRSIIHALTLSDCYAITGDFAGLDALLHKATRALERGAGALQLRAKLSDKAYIDAANALLPLVRTYNARLILNTSFELWQDCPEADWHATSDRLASLMARPVPLSTLFTASVHNKSQLQQAVAAGVDAVLLSPVLPTLSHPDEPALGWDVAQTLIAMSPVPVYALGGLAISDLAQAKALGFQGIAAIGAFWHD